MADTAWDRRPRRAREAERDRLLAQWLNSEVVPFNAFWAKRLGGRTFERASDLGGVTIVEEAELAGAGGPGNPALLVLPTEEGFKQHAARSDLLAAAREAATGGADARRAALFRRYKPVHIHEAGVAVVMAVAYTRTDLDRLHLAGARLTEVLGLGADDRLVNGVPAGPSIRFWGLYHMALAARMTALHPRQAGLDAVLCLARAVAMLPPTVLALPGGEAGDLLEGLAEHGVSTPHLRTVLLVGSPPSGDEREAVAGLARRLGAPEVRVQAVWAPETSRALWGECRPASADPHAATYGLHTYPDLEFLEVRDVFSGRPAQSGEEGELVLTSLGWRGTVLIRFATGSWTGGLVDVGCPNCGRLVPRLAPQAAEGAWQPRVMTGEGKRVRVDLRRVPSILDRATLASVGVEDWSVRVDAGQLVLCLDAPGAANQGLVALAQAVGRAVGATPVVRLDPAAARSRPRLHEAGVRDGSAAQSGGAEGRIVTR